MLRLLRLIKLARILRASRIFSRWENRISISYGNQSLIKLFIGVLLMLHWLSCLLGLMAQLMTPFRPPDMRASVELAQTNDPTCVGCTDALNTVRGSVCFSVCLTECEIMSEVNNTGSLEAFVRSSEAWVCRYASSGKIQAMPAYHGEVWIAGLYVAMIQLGGGVGSIVPENLIEYIVYWLCIFLGSLAWAGVVGTICAVLTTSDPSTLEFKVDMDSLNYFMEDMNMPNGLRLRVREYLRNKRDLYKKRSYNDLLDILSPELKTEVVHKMSGDLLSQVWYLHELEKENERPCLVELSTSLQRAVFAPREKVPAIGLNILMRGVAAKSGNILTPITTWGEDVIVTSQALRDSRTASALTFVEIAYLTRDVIYGVVSKYPMSHAIIKNAAMKIAMQRSIVVVSEFMSASTTPLVGEEGSARAALLAKMQREGGGRIDGAQIIPAITGLPFKELNEIESQSPQTKDDNKGSRDDKLLTIEKALSTQDAAHTKLAGKVDAMADKLDQIFLMLQAQAPTI